MSLAIENLLELGAIVECEPQRDQFISNIFLIQKPNGSYRFILNLKQLNKFVVNYHFKMEDFRTASKILPNNGYMATIDLKESYLLVPVATEHRKFLRFQFKGNFNSRTITYEFTAMPYGLSSAPRTFTKIMKEVIAYLRFRGFRSVIYLDDILCLGNTYNDCLTNVRETLNFLKCLGFIVNSNKSCLEPQQCCKFLGFMFNSIDMTISLPLDKRSYILQLTQKFSQLTTCKIRDLAHLIGVLTSACPAVRYGWIYTKILERLKFLALQSSQNYDTKITITKDILPDLTWWSDNIMVASNSLTVKSFDLEIFTDASKIGWGAYCDGKRAGGEWKIEERDFHINYLELLAVFLGLKCFVRNKKNLNLLLRIDNTTAISYVNRMGGIQFPHLNNLSRMIWQWCEERKIWIFASYINTKDNVEADQESRNPDIELQLSNSNFQQIVSKFGRPEIDLFASRTSAKCNSYVSWRPDPDALTVDAFTLNWKSYYFYAFPPFSIILRCIQKIINEEAKGILVFPYWPSQPWFPMLIDLLNSEIMLFPQTKTFPSSSCSVHLQGQKQFTLAAAVLSGQRSSQGEP